MQYQTATGSVTEPGSSPDALAVGAACWRGTAIESFSSRGPTIGGVIKPDLTGPDRVSTKTYGAAGSTCTAAGGFPGTSAAAPHVAGAAALVKGAYPSFTADQVESYLEAQAQDLGTTGKDNIYGFGLLHLPTVAVPGAPTGVHGLGYNLSAAISWTAPATNGGSPVTGYTVTSSPGNKTCKTTGALTCTVTGLTNGTPYTFTVIASNAAGPGPASDPSGAITPNPGPPLAPAGVTAVRGDTSASVSWTAPDANGSPITGYTVTSSTGGRTCTWSTGPLSCTVTGLTNGTAYTFTVHATNGLGIGPASAASNSVTPAGHPLKPTNVAGTPYNQSVLVSWQAAPGNGSPITGYTVTSTPGGKTCTTTGALSCTVTGLANGTPYTFTVRATNSIGDGPESDPSAAATPWPVPDAPTVLSAIGLDGSAVVTWAAPASDNGSPITLYTVTSSPGGKTCTSTASALLCTVTGLANRTAYTFTVTGENAVGPGPASAPSAVVTPLAGATYVALNPTRLLDTRSGNGLSGAFTTKAARTFQVTGRTVNGVTVPIGAVGVTGNLTVTGQTSPGYLFMGPVATNSPTSSTLNFPVGDTRANGVTVALSGTGTLSVTYVTSTAGKTAHVVFDVTGYFMANASGATYVALNPTRLLDTRSGNGLSGAFTTKAARTFQVTGRTVNGVTVPIGAVGVTGNLTVTGQTSPGYLFMGPVATNSPTSSTLNFPVGDTRANGVTVALSGTGTLSVTYVTSTAGKTAHVVFDVTGYFMANASGATYVALNPTRLLDTRSGNGLSGAFTTKAARTFQVTGRTVNGVTVPIGAVGVTGNLTVTGQTSPGYLFMGPVATNSPTSSTLNFPVGDTRANGVTVALSGTGTLSVTYVTSTAGKTAHVVFDVTGYFMQ